MRYDTNFRINTDIQKKYNNHGLPPLTIQTLVENAVKHNVVSQKKPLHIDVKSVGNYIIIRNNIQLKITESYSPKVGLSNIKNRFKYLTESAVEIVKNEDYFEVKIPLIDRNECINN